MSNVRTPTCRRPAPSLWEGRLRGGGFHRALSINRSYPDDPRTNVCCHRSRLGPFRRRSRRTPRTLLGCLDILTCDNRSCASGSSREGLSAEDNHRPAGAGEAGMTANIAPDSPEMAVICRTSLTCGDTILTWTTVAANRPRRGCRVRRVARSCRRTRGSATSAARRSRRPFNRRSTSR